MHFFVTLTLPGIFPHHMIVFSNVASNIVPGGPAILFHGKLTNVCGKRGPRMFSSHLVSKNMHMLVTFPLP